MNISFPPRKTPRPVPNQTSSPTDPWTRPDNQLALADGLFTKHNFLPYRLTLHPCTYQRIKETDMSALPATLRKNFRLCLVPAHWH
ncbi:MAG: hypothetical protein ACTXOO_04395 [Sodalis sp. (in: enterobacteria)]